MAEKKATIDSKKSKKSGRGGGHGGAWKVAYADFVTAMMAFFLVMWLMGADEETKAAIEHYFNWPTTPWKDFDAQEATDRPMGERTGPGENLLNGLAGLYPEDLVKRPVRPMKDDQD